MIIKRITPNLNVTDATAGHEFYTEFLGLEKAFDLGWIASFRSGQQGRYEIIHPLTDEAWGVRRFFVRDRHGNVVNIVAHPD